MLKGWQGNPAHGRDRLRSVPLACFAAPAQMDGIRLFSLQKGAVIPHFHVGAGEIDLNLACIGALEGDLQFERLERGYRARFDGKLQLSAIG